MITYTMRGIAASVNNVVYFVNYDKSKRRNEFILKISCDTRYRPINKHTDRHTRTPLPPKKKRARQNLTHNVLIC